MEQHTELTGPKRKSPYRQILPIILLFTLAACLVPILGVGKVLGYLAGGAAMTFFGWLVFDKWLGGYERRSERMAQDELAARRGDVDHSRE